VRAANQTNTISPPSDYDGCTREKMYKSKCRKRWVNQKSLTLHRLFTLQGHKTDDTTLFADNMWLSTLNTTPWILQVRHYMNKTTTSLSNCLMRVKGLSQTCDLYDACGPPSSFKPTLLSHTSVCSAPEGYYNEEYVER
jgi:hypothetical protein